MEHVFGSPIVAELTGYRSEEFIANTITFEALLHHEDKTYVRDVIDEALQSGKGATLWSIVLSIALEK